MQDRCVNCQHWGGTSHSGWGDCQYIVGEVCPWIFRFKSLHGWKLTLPLDPHDVKYYEGLNKRLSTVGAKDIVSNGVWKVQRPEQDVRFILNPHGEIIGERAAKVKVNYFKTARLMPGCQYYERRQDA